MVLDDFIGWGEVEFGGLWRDDLVCDCNGVECWDVDGNLCDV